MRCQWCRGAWRTCGEEIAETGERTAEIDDFFRSELVHDPGGGDHQTHADDPGNAGCKHDCGHAGIEHCKIEEDNGGVVQQKIGKTAGTGGGIRPYPEIFSLYRR